MYSVIEFGINCFAKKTRQLLDPDQRDSNHSLPSRRKKASNCISSPPPIELKCIQFDKFTVSSLLGLLLCSIPALQVTIFVHDKGRYPKTLQTLPFLVHTFLGYGNVHVIGNSNMIRKVCNEALFLYIIRSCTRGHYALS